MGADNTRIYLFAGLLAAVGLGILLYLGLTGASLKVYSVDELANPTKISPPDDLENLGNLESLGNRESLESKEPIQIYGRIAEIHEEQQLLVLKDRENSESRINIWLGSIPLTNLKTDQDVFVTGAYDPAKKQMTAKEVITTCPSKYKIQQPNQ